MRTYISLKEQLKDDVCKCILILGALVYAAFFGIILLLYPYQFNDDGLQNTPIVIGLILSFVLLCIVIFYLYRMYDHRVYQLRVLKSRKRYRTEMRELRKNWEKMQQAGNTEKEDEQ